MDEVEAAEARNLVEGFSKMLVASHYNGELIDILLRKCYTPQILKKKRSATIELARVMTKLRYDSDYFFTLILETVLDY